MLVADFRQQIDTLTLEHEALVKNLAQQIETLTREREALVTNFHRQIDTIDNLREGNPGFTVWPAVSPAGDFEDANRVRLERMLLEPGKYRFVRVARQDLGEPGCGVWQVRPRLGLIGMLAGWWQVKLSSGCPLAMGSRLA